MIPEEMKFWLDVLHSPAVIAIAGGLAGSFITLVVTVLKNRHDSKEREKAWLREEEKRKEERAFSNKNLAYEELLKHLAKGPELYLIPPLCKIVLYGPYEAKKYAKNAMDNIAILDAMNKNSTEYIVQREKVQECMRNLNKEIIKDLDKHFDRKSPFEKN